MTPDQIRAAITASKATTASLEALLPEAPRLTVRQVLVRYMAGVEFRSLRSIKTEEGRIRLHIARLLGDDFVDSLTRERTVWYRDQRMKEDGIRDGTTTSAATRNREVIRLSAALSWAVENDVVLENPILGAPPENEDNERSTCPTTGDVSRILLACNSLRLRGMVATSFWTGLRRGEIVAAETDQIVWDEGLIVLLPKQTKTRKGRVTIFPDRASHVVREYLASRDVKSRFMFCTKSGAPVSARNYLRDFQATAALAGVEAAVGERLVLHDLRSGFVGRQLELGTAEKTIMEMTGHSTHSAFDRYVRVQRRWLTDARERTDRADLTELREAKRKPPIRARRAKVDPSETKAMAESNSSLTSMSVSGNS